MTFLRPLLPIATYVSLAAAGIFQLSIFDIESPLNGQIVNAAGEAFYAGLSSPASYCPHQGASECPVEVPGGQQVYVLDSGEIVYTPPHSESPPNDLAAGQFTNTTVVSDCAAPFTIFNWRSASTPVTGGILACPKILQGSTDPKYQIYARTPGFKLTNCTVVLGLLPHLQSNNAFGAWEYA
ncbi:hypothetical protein M430DRAFT_42224 [Amorphotheca resinae ATCC 22711]|uniref:IgE-binding protein n=1 Tax=Amorphotheca resinae ATCC 22711 TaxID=857342 RepID=A0A2T3B1W7_AMORE|nr:hypothetical protein M430DRAFT_42224 [Amorphotheca resinae ATCC 22711]PSS18556.1 hypothetical protein M430DRAFT_42224 [Amorphotheca resinae ATCC 22711]